MYLKAFAVEARDKPGEPLRLEIELAAAAAAIQVRLQQRRGSGLDHAIRKNLDRGRSHASAGEPGAPLQQTGHLFFALPRIRPQRRDHACRELPRVVKRFVSGQNFVTRIGFLGRDDAEAVSQFNRVLEPGGIFAWRGRGNPLRHEVPGGFAQRAGGFSGHRIALNTAAGRVGRIFGDAGSCQGLRVGPA